MRPRQRQLKRGCVGTNFKISVQPAGVDGGNNKTPSVSVAEIIFPQIMVVLIGLALELVVELATRTIVWFESGKAFFQFIIEGVLSPS